MGSFRDILSEKKESTPPKLTRFYLFRAKDESGVSGTGIVAVGVKYPSGRCIIEWISKRTGAKSLGVYEDMDDLVLVHGHGGKTEVRYYDGDEEKEKESENDEEKESPEKE